MNQPSNKIAPDIRLEDTALEQIADGLTRIYGELYEVPPLDPRLSLTGNMLAFVFAGGLLPADEKLLAAGHEQRLRDFRDQFFQVASDELIAEVTRLTEMDVTTSFNGFDPKTRTTYLVFVLDLAGQAGSEERRAVLGWSEQVRRNAQRLHDRHAANKVAHTELREQWRGRQETMGRDGDEPAPPNGDGPSDDR